VNVRVRVRSAADAAPGVATGTALGVVSGAVLVGWAAQIAASWGPGYWPFDAAAGLAVCACAVLRRRHLVAAVVAGLSIAAVAIAVVRLAHLPPEPGPGLALGLAVLIGSAVRAFPAAWAGAVAAAGLALVAGTRFATPPPVSPLRLGDDVTATTVLNATTWLASVLIGLCLRWLDARRLAAAERVRRDERLALARELHDVVAHHITGIVLQAQAAQLVAGEHPLTGPLAGIEAAGSDALAAMRRVVGLLRDTDDAAPATAGPERISELVDRFAGHGPPVQLRMPDGERRWPPEVTSTVYRVVQESLTNISRHAPHASAVTVSVAQEQRRITVEVVDDATPAPARHHRGGYGLVGMRERVETLGGTLLAGPRPGAGWSVRAMLPVPDPEPR
jgi:signal transduction histidine kinase